MIFPEQLRKGDSIAIISPASKIDGKLIDGACRTIESWGFKPVQSEFCKGECGYEGEGNDMRAVFTCSEVDLPTNGGKASAFELDLINRCLYAITHQG